MARFPTEMEGVALRLLAPDDAAAYHAVVQENRDHLTRLGDFADVVSTSVDDLARQLADPDDRSHRFGVWRRDELVGDVTIVHGEPPRWGFGYWLAEHATGAGLMTAACRTALAFARDALGAEEVLAGVTHGNSRSVAVLRRLGFVEREDFDTYTRFGITLTTKLRKSGRVIVIDEHDRVLLFHGPVSERPARSAWYTPGGRLEQGETYEAAAIRELFEETGLDGIELGPCVWVRRSVRHGQAGPVVADARFFLVRSPSFDVDLDRIEPGEHVRKYRWWSLEDLRGLSPDARIPRRLPELLEPVLRGDALAQPIDASD